jgi:hypothetical protein
MESRTSVSPQWLLTTKRVSKHRAPEKRNMSSSKRQCRNLGVRKQVGFIAWQARALLVSELVHRRKTWSSYFEETVMSLASPGSITTRSRMMNSRGLKSKTGEIWPWVEQSATKQRTQSCHWKLKLLIIRNQRTTKLSESSALPTSLYLRWLVAAHGDLLDNTCMNPARTSKHKQVLNISRVCVLDNMCVKMMVS